MPTLRPVSHEARLTLVEHLSELRTRLFVSLGILVVAFSFTYWQHKNVLDIVNRPLEKSQKVGDCRGAGDALEKSACFDQAVAKAMRRLTPALSELSRTTTDLAAGRPAAERGRTAAQVRRVGEASRALDAAARLAPTSTKRQPVTLGVAEPFFQTINVSLYAALVIALPLLLFQLYAFLIPAFTTRERRVVLPMMIGIPFLFYAGVAFGYFLALPRAVDFLQNFNDQAFDVLVQAKDYYKFVALFLAGTGIVFQIPVLVLGISRLGVMNVRQLRKQRGIVVLIAAVVSAVITPTPDPVTMLLVMAPLVVLFEISVLIAAYLEKRSPPGRRWSEWGGLDDEDDDLGADPDDPPGGSGPDDDATLDGWAGDVDEDEDPPLWELDPDEGHADPGATRPRPAGEEPDPALAGDPAGPRLADAPDDEGDPWWSTADDLDADDPYAASGTEPDEQSSEAASGDAGDAGPDGPPEPAPGGAEGPRG